MSTASKHIDYPPLEGSARMWGTIALSAATFMNVLDSSIANVSLPAIAGDLGVSPNQGTWVITSFGVANAIALPLTGWLSQRFGVAGEQQGLRQRNHRPGHKTLQDSEGDQRGHIGCQAAQPRGQYEQQNAGYEKSDLAEALR